jgi:hypothetical protein
MRLVRLALLVEVASQEEAHEDLEKAAEDTGDTAFLSVRKPCLVCRASRKVKWKNTLWA